MLESERGGSSLDGAVSSIIETIRNDRGIGIAELARRVSVDKKRLWYVLNGQRKMRVDEFLKLCIALRIDPRSFVTHEMIDGIAKATARSIDIRSNGSIGKETVRNEQRYLQYVDAAIGGIPI